MTKAHSQFTHFQPEESDSIQRVALLVEYCGKNFHGSQFQPNVATVQAEIQKGLAKLGVPSSAVSFAGRTDAGVNAHGQVAHFDVCEGALKNIANLAAALNAQLPDTVAIRDFELNAHPTFHSRRDAAAKWYRYRIYNNRHRSALMGSDCAYYGHPLDELGMHFAAQHLLGSHCFSSFKDSSSPETNDWCIIYHTSVQRDGEFINFDIAANRFLYKMVRNLTGQLLKIGNRKNSLSPESILQVLAEQDRRQVAPPASPEGLSLMAVVYPSPFNYFESDARVRQLTQLLKSTHMESPHNENLFRKAS